MPVKERDAEQCRCEQDEVEWNSEKENWFGQFGLKCVQTNGPKSTADIASPSNPFNEIH
jgi:hypothetical protein